MHQFFICNQDEVERKLKTLIMSGTSSDGLIHYYLEKPTNQEWHLIRYDSEYHGGVVPVLKRLPEPSIEQLINIAITSDDINDIIGASFELSEREKITKENFRDRLLSHLLLFDTNELSTFEKERIKLIIYESNLYDETNLKDIVGKNFSEIQNDANYYQAIATKAKNILSKIVN